MKILVCNNHLHTIGGSETWVATVINVLEKFLCDVDVFTFIPGHRSHLTPDRPPKEKYDLILCNHNSCFKYCLDHVKFDKITFISHGIAHPLEVPYTGADRYVSITEEVRAKNFRETGIESEVILNPVDLDEFYPVLPINKPPHKVLGILQGEKAQERLKSLKYELKLTPRNRHERRRLNIVNVNNADLVFSLGRGAYESMACGRPVIVYDSRSYMGELYDGLITKENIEELVKCNCSGRATRGVFDIDRVSAEIEQIYNVAYYRSIAEEYFNADKIVKQLIE